MSKKTFYLVLLPVFLCTGVLFGQLQDNAYWPMYHNDALHTGRSSCIGPENPAVKWSRNIGSSFEMSSPIIDNAYIIYVGSRSGTLYAFNPDSTVKWTYSTGDRIMASAAIARDSTIYVGSCNNSLHAINYDGTGKWTYATGSWLQSSPAIDDSGIVHVGGYDTDLYAVEDSVTYGKRRWNYNTGGNVFSDPAVGTDGTHYCGSCDNRLYAIDKDGGFQWSYLASGDFYYSSAAIGTDGTIYVGANDNRLHAVNPDGSQKWTYLTGGYINGCPALALDGTIYIGSRDDNLYALEDSVTYAKLKWTYATSGDINYSSPIIDAQGVIYVGSCDHNLYAIEDSVTYGNLKWSITLDSDIWTTAAIGPDTVLYILSSNGTFYAIGEGATGVELTNFTALSEQNRIVLRWRTEQESNSVQWYILKRNIKDDPDYTEIGRVKAKENSPRPANYSFFDDDIAIGCTYYYKLGLLKTDGNTDWYGPVSVQAIGEKGTLTVFPNPFTSSTTIYFIGTGHDTRRLELQILDVTGRSVRRLSIPNSEIQIPNYSWDGRDEVGKVLPPGVYFLKVGGECLGKVVKMR